MKILFIGGTGIISSACTELAVHQGIEMHLLNRARSARPVPQGAFVHKADIRDIGSVRQALDDQKYDVVVDWIAFTPEHIQQDIDLFRGRTEQFIFISSASVYQKPPFLLPVTESTLADNPFWTYSQNKIACENLLIDVYRKEKFPVTIVRPSHTYDKTLLPTHGGYTIVHRMRSGKPVIVHGDGTSIWTMTHHKDFARGFNGLLGNPQAYGQIFHITSDEMLTWNQIYTFVANAAGVEKPELIHIASETIASFDQVWGASLIGDKAHSMIFDNSKIKRLVPEFACSYIPFSKGAAEILAWYDADPSRQVINEEFDQLVDRIIDTVRIR